MSGVYRFETKANLNKLIADEEGKVRLMMF